MGIRSEEVHFWLPVVGLVLFACYSGTMLVRAHVSPSVDAPNYYFETELTARRGSIYGSYGRNSPLAKSVPFWRYSLDPLALSNAVACGSVRRKGEPPRPRAAILKTISEALGLDYQEVKKMANTGPRPGWRSQFLADSTDPDVHRTLADSKLVAGVAIQDLQGRRYLHARSLAHVLGSVNEENVASAGVEIKYDKYLTGKPGLIRGMRDANRRELYDRRIISIDPVPGDDVFLTIDPNVQFEVEDALRWGLKEYGAGSGWCIVMDVATGAVLAMASYPDFAPLDFGNAPESAKINRAIGFNYEPGSVMKVITAAAAIDAYPQRYGPMTLFSTKRDDPRYYRLPGDGSHVWEPTMTLKHAIVHSSNIVIGKLGYDLGPKTLWTYMTRFGFGKQTGVGLPGEQFGILHNWKKWDKATWSRAAIGQGVSVTAMQLASAYQSIANDGIRMKPYVVDRIVASDGNLVFRQEPTALGRTVSEQTSRTIRKMMLEVASREGTARRARVSGYSVAGKTGTAQKTVGKSYAPGLYRASFCGIVPSGVVSRADGEEPMPPKILVLVTLDFDACTKYHQGGNSAGPVFRKIVKAATRYLEIAPDRPSEMEENDDEDEFDQRLEERVRNAAR